jgi:hypothetical protein
MRNPVNAKAEGGTARNAQQCHPTEYSTMCAECLGTIREPAEHLEKAPDQIDEFHQESPDWPREYGYRVRGRGNKDTEGGWTLQYT